MSEWISDGLVILLFVGAYFLCRARNRPPGDPKETRE